MYKIDENDIKTVSDICGVPNDVAIVALQYARGNVSVAIMELKFNRHFVERMVY